MSTFIKNIITSIRISFCAIILSTSIIPFSTMYKLFLFLIIAPLLSFSQTNFKNRAKGELIIIGSIAGKIETGNYIYAYFLDGSKTGLDSSKLINGKYTFRSKTGTTTLVTLYLKHPDDFDALKGKNMFVFLTEPAIVKVSSMDSFSYAKVSGSKANIEFNKLEINRELYSKQIYPLFKDYSLKKKNSDKEGMALIQGKIDSLREGIANMYMHYIKTNPSSSVVPYALILYIDMQKSFSEDDVELVKKIYATFSPGDQASHYGEKVKKKMESFDIRVNMMAPAFSQADTSGNLIYLDSYKGKYILLDFWASWCVPCRKENPILVKAYNAYKDKGFTVLSISLDKPGDKDKWITAIQKDKLTWTHLSDLKFWDNSVAKLYKINAIPQNFLIDPTGKIIGIGLHGVELEEKLNEILNK